MSCDTTVWTTKTRPLLVVGHHPGAERGLAHPGAGRCGSARPELLAAMVDVDEQHRGSGEQRRRCLGKTSSARRRDHERQPPTLPRVRPGFSSGSLECAPPSEPGMRHSSMSRDSQLIDLCRCGSVVNATVLWTALFSLGAPSWKPSAAPPASIGVRSRAVPRGPYRSWLWPPPLRRMPPHLARGALRDTRDVGEEHD